MPPASGGMETSPVPSGVQGLAVGSVPWGQVPVYPCGSRTGPGPLLPPTVSSQIQGNTGSRRGVNRAGASHRTSPPASPVPPPKHCHPQAGDRALSLLVPPGTFQSSPSAAAGSSPGDAGTWTPPHPPCPIPPPPHNPSLSPSSAVSRTQQDSSVPVVPRVPHYLTGSTTSTLHSRLAILSRDSTVFSGGR